MREDAGTFPGPGLGVVWYWKGKGVGIAAGKSDIKVYTEESDGRPADAFTAAKTQASGPNSDVIQRRICA